MRLVTPLARGMMLAVVIGLPASADAKVVDGFIKVEGAVSVPVSTPQRDLFNPGFGGTLKVGIGFGGVFDLHVTGLLAVMQAKSDRVSVLSQPAGAGGGIRLKLPNTFKVSPWVDADALYVRTGPYDRFGYSVGLGLHIPLGTSRMVRLGPFARLVHIIDTSEPGFNSNDGLMVLAGLSLEMGTPIRRDRDGDGIVDESDRCPDRAGPQHTYGCPDRDGDGVLDGTDQCPDVKGPIDTYGCPDRDGDGVIDSADKCPDVKGPAETGGCPDRDGDGVLDAADKCPDVNGPAVTAGCPDRDGDGVLDAADKCPDIKGPAETAGCPDRDGDGVLDEGDKCPDQAGPADNQGCPVPKTVRLTETKVEILQKIQFATKQSTILPPSFQVLDEVAGVLKANPKLRVRIEGHTDIRGGARFNQKLSQARAESVRRYLIEQGIAAERLQAKGYGPNRPIGANDTDAGREQNRRVEFVITAK
jgi:outer membrane protein OmpA-like peptidoglycan-associated protein